MMLQTFGFLTESVGVIYDEGNLVQRIMIFSCADAINYSMTTNTTTLNSNFQVKNATLRLKRSKIGLLLFLIYCFFIPLLS